MKKNIEIRRPMAFLGQSYGSPILKHKELPIYKTYEFNFFRCIPFEDTFYKRTVSQLHAGNLRNCELKNRNSKLFPNEKTSYWSQNQDTARSEMKKHNPDCKSMITFWAYDDVSSTFPTIDCELSICIINGKELGFNKILNKSENNISLSTEENEIVDRISEERPDCLVYESIINPNYLNYLFFKRGFDKLSIREVSLRLNRENKINKNHIICADSSDYIAFPGNYGFYFDEVAKVRKNDLYLESEEYKQRNRIYRSNLDRYFEKMKSPTSIESDSNSIENIDVQKSIKE